MKNIYKRTDVFACNYQSHSKFDNKVSVYHVLKVKKCYPQGCIFFKWRCKRFEKGKTCVRGFNHIGRLCKGCMSYVDEKVHYQPKIQLSKLEYERFKSELEEFEEWIRENQNRDVEFWCKIDSIKPFFRKIVSRPRGHFLLKGYLLISSYGFIGMDSFDDHFYISISPHQQERYNFAVGDSFDAKGYLGMDRGRIVMNKVGLIDFEERSHNKTWKNSDALVAKQVATCFTRQPEKCLHCQYGALVDLIDKTKGQNVYRRELYCLRGIQDPHTCYIQEYEKIDTCSKQ